jgi:hypothetical protein
MGKRGLVTYLTSTGTRFAKPFSLAFVFERLELNSKTISIH